jgi:hypothetical protein
VTLLRKIWTTIVMLWFVPTNLHRGYTLHQQRVLWKIAMFWENQGRSIS